MQVPVVMTTALGQKISTVAVQQPTGATGASSHPALLTSTSTLGSAASAAANANTQQKVRKHTRQFHLHMLHSGICFQTARLAP